MPTDLFARIMETLHKNFNVAPDAETTLEANPGTPGAACLPQFIAAGVNRLSVGVQSLDDADLGFLGRRHTADEARALIGTAQDARIRVSGDFIYAVPRPRALLSGGQAQQDLYSVEKMCRGIVGLGLQHASLYELSVEPGTPLARRGAHPVDDNVAAVMYEKINEILSPRLPRYEVSNHAMPGEECRHNANIWAGAPYLGIGPSACGRVFINGIWYEQSNAGDIKKWIAGDPNNADINAMSDRTRAVEKIMTGLRTARGIKITDDIRDMINWDYVERNTDLLIMDAMTPVIRATDRGMIVLDKILVDLIL